MIERYSAKEKAVLGEVTGQPGGGEGVEDSGSLALVPIDLLRFPQSNARSECTEMTRPRSYGGLQPAADVQYLCGAEFGFGSEMGETGST